MSQYAISPEEQILCMMANGITFHIVSAEEAKRFLSDKNFFFKVKAFDKNFEKYTDKTDPNYDKYINLDFAYLIDLSRKDALLRELILDLALDLEHYLKVAVNRFLMSSHIEIGTLVADFNSYTRLKSLGQIVETVDLCRALQQVEELAKLTAKFRLQYTDNNDKSTIATSIAEIFDKAYALSNGVDINHTERSFGHLGSSFYSRKLFEKYGQIEKMEPWHFMEMASFGDFIAFYKFLFFDFKRNTAVKADKDIFKDASNAKKVKNYLFPAKTLRNAAAHNDCLLNTLKHKLRSPKAQIRDYLKTLPTLDKQLIDLSWKTSLVHDYASLLICYDYIIPHSKTKKVASNRLGATANKLLENSTFYEKHVAISNPLKLLAGISISFSQRWSI